jgi:hypothetical protein
MAFRELAGMFGLQLVPGKVPRHGDHPVAKMLA